MKVCGGTHIGLVRENNQDAFVYDTLDETAQFAVVCDGMGGANGGNIASQIAVDIIGERIRASYPPTGEANWAEYMLASAMAAANAAVFDRSLKQPELSGMGTTVVAVVTCGKTAYISHVGDSRLYLFRQGHVRQITRDHSVVQNMIESGQITEEQAKSHPRRHFITRALGVTDDESGEYDELTLEEGDRLLLCTDGLTNMVEPQKMQELLALPSDEVTDALIQAALDGGGSDNVTVVLME